MKEPPFETINRAPEDIQGNGCDELPKSADEKMRAEMAELISLLENGLIENFLEIKRNNPFSVMKDAQGMLTDEIYNFPEIRAAAWKGAISCLRVGDLDAAELYGRVFSLYKEMISSQEALAASWEGIALCLKVGDFDKARRIHASFPYSEEMLYATKNQTAIMEGILLFLRNGDTRTAYRIIERYFPLSDETLSSSETQTAVREHIISCTKEGNVDTIRDTLSIFRLPYGTLDFPEFFTAALKGIILCLGKGDVSKAEKILNAFPVPKEMLNSPEIHTSVLESIVSHLKNNQFENASEILALFPLSREILDTPEFLDAVEQSVLSNLRARGFGSAIDITRTFPLPEAILKSPEVLAEVKGCLLFCLKNADARSAKEIINAFIVSDETLHSSETQSAVLEGVICSLQNAKLQRALDIQTAFPLSNEILNSPEIHLAVQEGIIACLRKGDTYEAEKILNAFPVPKEILTSSEIRTAVLEGIVSSLKNGQINRAESINTTFFLSQESLLSIDRESREDITTALVFSPYSQEFQGFSPDIQPHNEDQLRMMWEKAQHFGMWRDASTTARPFESGSAVFGFKRMLAYIKNADSVSLHDSLYAFEEILDLYRSSGLDPNTFYTNILAQVMRDGSNYDEGSSRHHLNAIVNTISKDIPGTLARAKKYNGIVKLQELLQYLETPQAVCASWINLKRFSQIESLLGQAEVLGEFEKLKTEGSQALYEYVEALAFHRDSKIKMQAVLQFWKDPEAFFSADASHTPPEAHDSKKPSNYIRIPNLDLSAVELRDALVEGKIDSISAFTPMEIRYKVNLSEMNDTVTLAQKVEQALGSRQGGVRGEARNPRKLFKALNQLFKERGLSIREYIKSGILPEGIAEDSVEDILYQVDIGMARSKINAKDFVIRIDKKSDPEGAIAGDDTANCMPFGDGKNTLYTFNPNTAQLVVRLVMADGRERTIAQSVLTKDIDIKTSVPEVLKHFERHRDTRLDDVLPQDVLLRAPSYVACDNVEVAPNYSDEMYQKIIDALYRDFFREYLTRFSERCGLNDQKVLIGASHSDALSNLPREKNTFIPQAPVSYSDKLGNEVLVLDLSQKVDAKSFIEKSIGALPPEKQEDAVMPSTPGITFLTFEDTLKVAMLEGKAYADNASLMQHLHNMENALIAKDISNAAKDRPNMSIKYEDGEGRTRGYLMAWEGTFSDEIVASEHEDWKGSSCIYISDLATDLEGNIAGGKLIQGFLELYKNYYLDEERLIPLYFHAREQTSYRILQKQLTRIGASTGIDFEVVELSPYTSGDDTMHPVILLPIKH